MQKGTGKCVRFVQGFGEGLGYGSKATDLSQNNAKDGPKKSRKSPVQAVGCPKKSTRGLERRESREDKGVKGAPLGSLSVV
jgi:hypothetical protein